MYPNGRDRCGWATWDLSRDQQKQSMQVASVPAQQFETAVERKKPATVTELATLGRKPSTAHLERGGTLTITLGEYNL